MIFTETLSAKRTNPVDVLFATVTPVLENVTAFRRKPLGEMENGKSAGKCQAVCTLGCKPYIVLEESSMAQLCSWWKEEASEASS